MKKLYILPLLIYLVPTSCMEMQRHKRYYPHNEVEIPLNTFKQPTTPISVYCQANEPSWEILNPIMDVPYKREQQKTTHSIDTLQPIYRSAEQNQQITLTNQSHETKKTEDSVKSNTDLMEDLYQKAFRFMDDELDSDSDKLYQRHRLATLVTQMNQAIEKGINEDIMAHYSHDHAYTWWHFGTHRYFETSNYCAAFLFYLLKKYRLTINETKEQLPGSYNKAPYILDTFYSSTCTNGEYIGFIKSEQSSAFALLNYNILKFTREDRNGSFKRFIFSLCGSSKQLRDDFCDGSYKNFSELYSKAFAVCKNSTYNSLYQFLQTIEQAKIKGDIIDENTFTNTILNKQEDSPTKVKMLTLFKQEYVTPSAKKRIALIYQLIAQYNNTRNNKITPTDDQLYAYYIQKYYDIPLPDSFDKSLFDENIYAIKESLILRDMTLEITNLTAEKIQEMAKDEL